MYTITADRTLKKSIIAEQAVFVNLHGDTWFGDEPPFDLQIFFKNSKTPLTKRVVSWEWMIDLAPAGRGRRHGDVFVKMIFGANSCAPSPKTPAK